MWCSCDYFRWRLDFDFEFDVISIGCRCDVHIISLRVPYEFGVNSMCIRSGFAIGFGECVVKCLWVHCNFDVTSGRRMVFLWLHCDFDVISMWFRMSFRFGSDWLSLRFRCVCDLISLEHRPDLVVSSMWLRWGTDTRSVRYRRDSGRFRFDFFAISKSLRCGVNVPVLWYVCATIVCSICFLWPVMVPIR